MAHVYFSAILKAPADPVWSIVRDFGSLPVWFPFVRESILDGGSHSIGTIRTNTVADGSVIRERLLALSDRDRCIVYDIVAADIPTKNYSATLKIHAISDGTARCFAEWTADFDIEGDRDAAIRWIREDIFRTCLRELEVVAIARGVAAS